MGGFRVLGGGLGFSVQSQSLAFEPSSMEQRDKEALLPDLKMFT